METFLKVLDPEDSSTGGGSASAIAGSMAGSLVAMASRLSDPGQDGLEKPFFVRIYTQASQLSQQLLEGSQKDAQAFQSVRSAYQLARQTDEEKIARQQAVQLAWFQAASVPLENSEKCLRVVELGVELGSQVNPKVLSDLHCALLLARAGLLGCLENVYINLPSLKDAAAAGQLSGRAGDLSRQLAELERSAPFNSPEK